MDSQTIGPYEIERRLGAGGMGEVYCAYDARLDRRVAVKLIRPEALASARARKRFRREARAAARLSHPSIVQVFDILERDEGDAIVMELVQGRLLSGLLAQGPCDLDRALRLAGEIAAGLAEAHAKGVVHRDLKAENVMVTPDGRAKILDFGLATKLSPAETDLSVEGKIFGTIHAMSPEQIQGHEVDHRSDLFSLGTLLYQVVTGRSPFRAESPVATLARIMTFRPPAVAEVEPEVPPALSLLIERLLEKDPSHRPRTADEVVEALRGIVAGRQEPSGSRPLREAGAEPPDQDPLVAASTLDAASSAVEAGGRGRASGRYRRALWPASAVLALTAGTFWLGTRTGEPIYVAVLRPQVASAPAGWQADLVVSGVRLGLIRGLTRLQGIAVIAPDQVDAVAGTSEQVGRAVAADEVITSSLDCTAEECQVALNRVRASDAALVWLRSFAVPTDNLLLVTDSVAASLHDGYGSHRARRGAPKLDVEAGDYEEFLRLRGSFVSRTAGVSLEELLARIREVSRSSPQFLEARLLEARIAQHRYFETGRLAELERALEATERARTLSPDDPRPLGIRFDVALDGGRLPVAEAALEALRRVAPGDVRVTTQRALLLERQGHPAEALGLMRRAARRRPSWGILTDLAQMERRLGEIAAARSHLEELVERFPDYFQGRYLLAHHELFYGRPERAAELCEELVRLSPSSLEALGLLGSAYFALERHAEAAARFRQILEIEPAQPSARLNLAYNLLALGDEGAGELLRETAARIAEDPNADHWSVLMREAMALAPLGEESRAMSSVARALQNAPQSPIVAYQAALVYALLGNEKSARFEAARALDLGLAPRWLASRWFDRLESDPEYRDRLERALGAVPR